MPCWVRLGMLRPHRPKEEFLLEAVSHLLQWANHLQVEQALRRRTARMLSHHFLADHSGLRRPGGRGAARQAALLSCQEMLGLLAVASSNKWRSNVVRTARLRPRGVHVPARQPLRELPWHMYKNLPLHQGLHAAAPHMQRVAKHELPMIAGAGHSLALAAVSLELHPKASSACLKGIWFHRSAPLKNGVPEVPLRNLPSQLRAGEMHCLDCWNQLTFSH